MPLPIGPEGRGTPPRSRTLHFRLRRPQWFLREVLLEEGRGVEPLTFPTLTGSNRVASQPSSTFRYLEPHQRIKLCFPAYNTGYVSDEKGVELETGLEPAFFTLRT